MFCKEALLHDCPAEGVPLRTEQFANDVEDAGDALDADQQPAGKRRGNGKGGRGGRGGRGRGGKGGKGRGGKKGKGKGKTKRSGKKVEKPQGGRGRGKGGKGRGSAATKSGSSDLTTPTKRPCKGDESESTSSPKDEVEAGKPQLTASMSKASAKKNAMPKSAGKPKAKAKPARKPKSSPSKPQQTGKGKRKAASKESKQEEEGGRDKCFARRYKPTRETAVLQWTAIRDAFNDHLRDTLLCPSKLEDFDYSKVSADRVSSVQHVAMQVLQNLYAFACRTPSGKWSSPS